MLANVPNDYIGQLDHCPRKIWRLYTMGLVVNKRFGKMDNDDITDNDNNNDHNTF